MMKKSILKGLAVLGLALICAGCASGGRENASGTLPPQLQQVPGMEEMDVMVVVKDIRPMGSRTGFGTSNLERPENYFTNTINLPGYTVDYLSKTKLFKSVSMTKSEKSHVLKLVWRSSHVNVNGWIPFVVRFQNTMTIDMSLLDPSGQVLWNYALHGDVVNTPSSFRIFRNQRCDIFQEKVLEQWYPMAFRDMCAKLSVQFNK